MKFIKIPVNLTEVQINEIEKMQLKARMFQIEAKMNYEIQKEHEKKAQQAIDCSDHDVAFSHTLKAIKHYLKANNLKDKAMKIIDEVERKLFPINTLN